MRLRQHLAPVSWLVRRMLPRSNLGRALMKKLKVYAGDKHPHAAQQPTVVEAING